MWGGGVEEGLGFRHGHVGIAGGRGHGAFVKVLGSYFIDAGFCPDTCGRMARLIWTNKIQFLITNVVGPKTVDSFGSRIFTRKGSNAARRAPQWGLD